MEHADFQKILMPTDFSDLAQSALSSAIAICKQQNASLTLLHAVDNMAFLTPTDVFLPKLEEVPDVLRTLEENMLKLTMKLSEQYKLKIKGIVETGNSADTICRVASRDGFDLIVLGSHGTSGVRELFMGSTAFKVIKQAPCPVLTIPGNWERNIFKRIIFPVRIMPDTLDKYKYALQLTVSTEPEFFVIGLSENETANNMIKLTELVDQLKLRLIDDKVKYSSTVAIGKDFAPKILEAAELYDADLITIIANLELDWNDIMVNPFAQQIVNHSKRPVLTVTPAKSQFKYTDM